MNQRILTRKLSKDRGSEVQVATRVQSQKKETFSSAIPCLTKGMDLMIL